MTENCSRPPRTSPFVKLNRIRSYIGTIYIMDCLVLWPRFTSNGIMDYDNYVNNISHINGEDFAAGQWN